MTDGYDVAIAGAGPAGAQCARDLAARDYDVVVLEAEPEDGFPRTSNKSTGGTFPSMLASFNVPDDVVMQFTDSVVIESPNDHYDRDQPGAVLEFADFKRFLVRDGREKGAEYRFDARATEPITEDVVVDATGPAAPLAKELGVTDLRREKQAIGVEYEFEGVTLDAPGYADLTDAMMLRLDHDVAPGGYAWIFHTGGDTAKVGVCYIQNERHREYAREDTSIDGYLQGWVDADPRFDGATRKEGVQHRGSAHIQMPGSLSTAGFMAIGDTVPTIDPLWGEGIHKGMQSGRAAAVTADNALTGGRDVSAEAMSLYDDRWHERVAPKMSSRLMLTEMLYLASNERYDELVGDLSRADPELLARANRGDKRALLRLLKLKDLPALAKLARERVAG